MSPSPSPSWWSTAVLLAVALPACVGWPKVLEPGVTAIADPPREAPRIRRVRDLGNAHLGAGPALAAEPDGTFTIGELLLIEGRGFGASPTLTLGGQPMPTVRRTTGCGIVARVPPGTPLGRQVLVISTAGGQDTAALPLRRLALLLDGNREQLHSLEISGSATVPPGLRPLGQPLPIPAAQHLALSSDGAAAYVLLGEHGATPPRLAVIDLVAPGSPRKVDTRDLSTTARLLAVARRGTALVVVGRERLTRFDVSEPRRPVWQGDALLPAEAPKMTSAATAAALSPDGALLALGFARDNHVLLIDFQNRGAARLAGVAQLQGDQGPLCELRFAADGRTLYALSGDGHQPTRVLVLPLAPGEDGAGWRLGPARSLELPDAGAPSHFALGSAGAVYVTTTREGEGGALWRLTGEASLLQAGAEWLGGLDLTPDGSLAVLGSEGAVGSAGLTAVVVQIRGGTVAVPLSARASPPGPYGPHGEGAGAAAARRLEVVVQP